MTTSSAARSPARTGSTTPRSPRRSGLATVSTSTAAPGYEALEASASFDRVLYDGAEFGGYADGTSDDEQDYLGLPGLLDADQVATLLRDRQARQLARGRRGRSADRRSDR